MLILQFSSFSRNVFGIPEHVLYQNVSQPRTRESAWNQSEVLETLLNIRSNFTGKSWGRVKLLVGDEQWKSFPSLKRPALVTENMLGTFSLGNNLGFYYQTRAFCHFSGLDWVSAPLSGKHLKTFLKFLPRVQLHPIGNYSAQLAQQYLGECHTWPHSCAKSRMIHYVPVIQRELSQALAPFRPSTAPIQTVIHFRCGDILGIKRKEYGLIMYKAFKKIIPRSAQEIVVMAQPTTSPCRKYDCRHNLVCSNLTLDLESWLSQEFSRASIEIRYERNISVAMATMAYARKLICSSSTFCLFSALANTHQAYLPNSPLFMSGTKPALSPSIHWFQDSMLTSKDIAEFSSTREVIQALRSLPKTDPKSRFKSKENL